MFLCSSITSIVPICEICIYGCPHSPIVVGKPLCPILLYKKSLRKKNKQHEQQFSKEGKICERVHGFTSTLELVAVLGTRFQMSVKTQSKLQDVLRNTVQKISKRPHLNVQAYYIPLSSVMQILSCYTNSYLCQWA